jgi:streptogramin lyase
VNFTSGYLAIFSSASGSFGTITALYNGLDTPYAAAIGTQGDPWIVNQFPSTVDELNSSAVLVNGAPFSGGNISSPSGVAVDGAGNAWVTNAAPTSDSITELSPAGLILSGSKGYAASCMAGPSGIAIDGSGNVWVGNSGEFVNCVGYGVTEFLGAAVPVVTPIAAGVVNGTLGTRP